MTLRLALTPGEPAGIGPDLLINLVQQGHEHELVAYADPQLCDSAPLSSASVSRFANRAIPLNH